jgi:hypothetical protein
MKRYVLIAAALVLVGCEGEAMYCTVSNNSSHPVSFQFFSVYTDEFTLQPGKTEVYDSIGNPTLKYFKVNGDFQNEKRKQVEYNVSYRDAEFTDFSPIAVRVYNTLSISVSLSADGYMQTEPMAIAGEASDQANFIYTGMPNFSVATDTYPASAECEIKNGVMYVTIR